MSAHSSAGVPRWASTMVPLSVALFALALYAFTSAPGLTWAHDGADGGDLIAAAATGGVPHPTGYPVYCLLARAFSCLPFGSIARRYNLFSATMGAITIVLIYLSGLRLVGRGTPHVRWSDLAISLFSALACATGYTLWSQATITEVYALNALFFALCLFLALYEPARVHTGGWACLGLAFGLGLGVHLTLLLLLPGLLILLADRASGPRLLAFGVGLLGGLCGYAYILLAARGSSPVAWGSPNTWGGFWWLVSGQLYRRYLGAVPPADLPRRLAAWATLWVTQYSQLGLAFSVLGLYASYRGGRRRWALATGLTFAAYSLYALTYNTTDSYVYLIPGYLLAALWLGQGIRLLIGSSETTRLRLALGLALLAAIPLWSVLSHYKSLDLASRSEASEWVETTLSRLPQGAALLTGDDRHTFALAYAQWVEGRRPDLLIVDGDLLGQPWYTEQVLRHLGLVSPSGAALSAESLVAILLPQRAVYLDTPRAAIEANCHLVPEGGLWQVTLGE